MNVERIRELADLIEKQPHTERKDPSGFNMSCYEHNCGSPACIAGWAESLYGPNSESLYYSATGALGLGYCEADELFYASEYIDGTGNYLSSITPSQAARTLRHLADTYEQTGFGEVKWEMGE